MPDKQDGPKLLTLTRDDQQAKRERRQRLIAEAVEECEGFARLTRARYLSLVEAGFTEGQALALCKM